MKLQPVSFAFTKPGVYTYYCMPHPFMRRTITVVPGTISAASNSAVVAQATNVVAAATVNDTIILTVFGLLVVVGLFVYFWWASRTKRQ